MSQFFEGLFRGRGESAEEQAAIAQESKKQLQFAGELWHTDLSEFAAQYGADEATVAEAQKLLVGVHSEEQKEQKIKELTATVRSQFREPFGQLIRAGGLSVAGASLAIIALIGPLGQASEAHATMPEPGQPSMIDPNSIEATKPLTVTASPEMTSTAELTSTQSFTLTRNITATNIMSNSRESLRLGTKIDNLKLIVVATNKLNGVPITVTASFEVGGKPYGAGNLPFGEVPSLFEAHNPITITKKELLDLLPPEAVTATTVVNQRKGPGTTFGLAGRLTPADGAQLVIGQSPDKEWLELANGNWVFAELVKPTAKPEGTGGDIQERKRQALLQSLIQTLGITDYEQSQTVLNHMDLVPLLTDIEQEQGPDQLIAKIGNRVIAIFVRDGETYVLSYQLLTGFELVLLAQTAEESSEAVTEPTATEVPATATPTSPAATSTPSATQSEAEMVTSSLSILLNNEANLPFDFKRSESGEMIGERALSDAVLLYLSKSAASSVLGSTPEAVLSYLQTNNFKLPENVVFIPVPLGPGLDPSSARHVTFAEWKLQHPEIDVSPNLKAVELILKRGITGNRLPGFIYSGNDPGRFGIGFSFNEQTGALQIVVVTAYHERVTDPRVDSGINAWVLTALETMAGPDNQLGTAFRDAFKTWNAQPSAALRANGFEFLTRQ